MKSWFNNIAVSSKMELYTAAFGALGEVVGKNL
jgi:hypothetical protein